MSTDCIFPGSNDPDCGYADPGCIYRSCGYVDPVVEEDDEVEVSGPTDGAP